MWKIFAYGVKGNGKLTRLGVVYDQKTQEYKLSQYYNATDFCDHDITTVLKAVMEDFYVSHFEVIPVQV